MRKRLRPLALQATAAERAEKLALEIASLQRADRAARSRRFRVEARGGRGASRDCGVLEARRTGPTRGTCSGSGRAPRRSSPTRPDDASPRSPRATGCRAESSGSSCARSRLQRCWSASARRLRLRRLRPMSRATPHVSSSRRSRQPRLPGAPSASGSRWMSGSSSSVSGFERSIRRSPSRRAFRPLLALSPRTAPRLALAALDIEPGAERAVAAALRARASAVLADDAAVGLALLQRARASGLGSLTVLTGRSPQEIVAEYPVVPIDTLLDVTAPSVTPEGFGYDPSRGELWFVGETAEAVLLELQGRRTALHAEAVGLEAQLGGGDSGRGRGGQIGRASPRRHTERRPRMRPATLDARLHARLVEHRGPPQRRNRRRPRRGEPLRGAAPRARRCGFDCGRVSSARSCGRSARRR